LSKQEEDPRLSSRSCSMTEFVEMHVPTFQKVYLWHVGTKYQRPEQS